MMRPRSRASALVFRAGAAVLVLIGSWVTWRMLISASTGHYSIGHTEAGRAQVWYPTSATPALGALRTRIYGWADLEDAPLAANVPPLPVLIYFGGWPGTNLDNQELIHQLAGEGFVVAVWRGAAAAETPMDFSSEAAFTDTLKRADARAKLLARAAGEVLDSLELLDRSDPSGRFTGRLDTSRAGILGYSFGGAVAAEAAWMDPRFKAVMNVDGWSFGSSAVEGIRQPYLYISDDTPLPTATDLASPDPTVRYTSRLTQEDYPRLLHNLDKHDGIYVSVAGTGHMSFVDRGWRSRTRELLGLPPDRPARVQRILRAYALAFFRCQLQGRGSELLTGPSTQFPEVRYRMRDRPS